MSEGSPVRYSSPDANSARWSGFPFRQGDIVISARSKSGTTWLQMICALLVFQSADLPAPLADLSPWLDWLGTPRDDVLANLAAQKHRRFVKTHTPLDGLPIDSRAAYLVVARHPLDMAVSLYHQGDNLNRERMRRLTGRPQPSPAESPSPSLHEWLGGWIEWDGNPRDQLDSLPGVLWHLSDAWARRAEPNVVLVHYDDLLADLEGEMRRLAALLEVDVDDATWPDLVHAARFEQMRARADLLAPGVAGILMDRTRFFRRGSSGAGREVLSERELADYQARAEQLASANLLDWLHREDGRPT